MAEPKQKFPRKLGSRAEFYLLYMLFYFTPWFFVTPRKIDVLAIIVALAVFLPVYFAGFKHRSSGTVPHIAIMTSIGFVISPFNGAHGVFHIYASVLTAFQRPERKAWIGLIVLAVVFLVFSLATAQHWTFYSFPLFIGLIVGISTIWGAEQDERQAVLERSREHDTHMAALAERERIAQDLHDLLGQTLTMVALKSEVAAKLIDKDPQQARQEIDEIRHASRTALSEVRDAVANMNRTSIAKEIQRARTILDSAGVSLEVIGEVPELETDMDRILGLAIREATTNIVRHARASHARLSLQQDNDGLEVIIQDDGEGKVQSEGSGLAGLRKRMEALGGLTKVEDDAGVCITLQVPRPENHEP